MNVLLIDTLGLGVDLGMEALRDGHKVQHWVKRTVKGDINPAGKGILPRVEDWEKYMGWADIIIPTDNNFPIRQLETYRKKGFPIFGPNMAGADLELNRTLGLNVLEKAQIHSAPYKEFSSYSDAIAHIKAHPKKRFVCKPCGDLAKELSYVSKSGQDMVFMLEKWASQGKPKCNFILQEFVGGIEVAVGGWMGSSGFSQYVCEGFEFKKLMPGNWGPNCYSADTEVLTENGWKFWPDVVPEDRICTLKDGNIEFEIPESITIGDFDGEMMHWNSPTVDILVTPGHNMYVQDDHSRQDFFFEAAQTTSTKNRNIMRGGGTWNGEDDLGQLPTFYTGTMKAWAALVGIYIADGNVKKKSLQFGNCPPHKQEVFKKIASDAGYVAKMYGTDLYINSGDLAGYFKDFGKCHEKYVPSYIKQGSTETIKAFLHGYGAGDGSSRTNNLTYTTVSKLLADDVQECVLKSGSYGAIKARDRRGESHYINGYLCENKRIAYDISNCPTRLKAGLSPSFFEEVPYSGKVYCCTVQSHIIYVRRNGKACWLGQTGEMGSSLKYTTNSQLFKETLELFEDHLVYTGYTGFIDLAFIIDEDGEPRPLEWTSRFGWPTRNIQAEMHRGDSIRWMKDLLDGFDTLKIVGEDQVGTGFAVCIPDFPYKTARDSTGYPIYGLEKAKGVHLCEVMMGTAPMQDGGNITNQKMIVSSGTSIADVCANGPTVSESAKIAYERVKQLEIPNSPIVRDDIGERLEKELPILQKYGYMKSWKY